MDAVQPLGRQAPKGGSLFRLYGGRAAKGGWAGIKSALPGVDAPNRAKTKHQPQCSCGQYSTSVGERQGKMTLEEMRTSSKAFLVPADVAPVLGCDPHFIRVAARDCPEQLGFPVTRLGSRTRIPRIPFLRYLGYEEEHK